MTAIAICATTKMETTDNTLIDTAVIVRSTTKTKMMMAMNTHTHEEGTHVVGEYEE